MGTRRGARPLAILVCLAAIVLCWAPASAQAIGEEETGASDAFRLRAGNGYGVLVLATSRPGFENGHVLLFVERGDGNAIYVAPATVTPTRIEADLGSLGEISVGFAPNGKRERAHSSCDDQSVAYPGGNWVGKIEFHGEEGYADAVATSTPTLVRPFLQLVCGGYAISEASGPGLPGARLSISSGTAEPRTYLRVFENRPGAALEYEAGIEEEREGIKIVRSVQGRRPGDGFHWTSDLRRASLKLPSPFSGHAVFHHANRWTGNLDVDFPGHSNVPLVGPGLRVRLVHAQRTRESASSDEKAG